MMTGKIVILNNILGEEWGAYPGGVEAEQGIAGSAGEGKTTGAGKLCHQKFRYMMFFCENNIIDELFFYLSL